MCPCGCRRPSRTKAGYAARGCTLRMISTAERSRRSKALAASLPPGELRKRGQKAGKATAEVRRRRWMARMAEALDRENRMDVIRRVYWLGYGAGYNARDKGCQTTKEIV